MNMNFHSGKPRQKDISYYRYIYIYIGKKILSFDDQRRVPLNTTLS